MVADLPVKPGFVQKKTGQSVVFFVKNPASLFLAGFRVLCRFLPF
jgi:hypothetical protein